MKVGGPINRYGGKGPYVDEIVPRLPRARLYLEPFFGGGSVFFALPRHAYAAEVVNDIDDSLVTFFRVLRERPDDLARVLRATAYARSEFESALARSEDPLEEARRVWIRSRQSINGVARKGTWARPSARPQGRRTTRGESTINDMHAFAARLREVAVECGDGIALIERYAQPDVAIYVDGPYHPDTRTGTWGNDGYRHELSRDDHERLVSACLVAVAGGAHVAVSGYACELYDKAFAAWRRSEFGARANAVTPGRAEPRTEVLWMSYPPHLELAAPVQQLALEVRP